MARIGIQHGEAQKELLNLFLFHMRDGLDSFDHGRKENYEINN
jgi:hypothetical protein